MILISYSDNIVSILDKRRYDYYLHHLDVGKFLKIYRLKQYGKCWQFLRKNGSLADGCNDN